MNESAGENWASLGLLDLMTVQCTRHKQTCNKTRRAISARNWRPESESAYFWWLPVLCGDGEPKGLGGYQHPCLAPRGKSPWTLLWMPLLTPRNVKPKLCILIEWSRKMNVLQGFWPAGWEAQGYGGKGFWVSHRLKNFYVVNVEIICFLS